MLEALDVRLAGRQAADLLDKMASEKRLEIDTTLRLMLLRRTIEDPEFLALAARKLAEWRNET
jgi:hypothetical protein